MFHSYRTKRFNELLAALPADVQRQASEAYELFKENPRHGSLQFKCVDPSENPPWYSVRIGAHYRALGTVEWRNDHLVLDWHSPGIRQASPLEERAIDVHHL